MNMNLRFLCSAAAGFGLLAFTLGSAAVAGAVAPVTVLGFALLAIYGLAELALLSYATPAYLRRARRRVAGDSVALVVRDAGGIRLVRGARNPAALATTRRAA